MAISREAQTVADAINANTRAIEKMTKALEKIARTKPPEVTQIFHGGSPEPLGDMDLQLQPPDQYDPTQ